MSRDRMYGDRLCAAWLLPLICGLVLGAGSPALGQEPGHDDQDDHGDDHDGEHVLMSEAEQQEFGIQLADAGAGTIRQVRQLPAEVRVNADRVAHIAPRYAGIATEVKVRVGDPVAAGDVLAIVESDESLALYEVTTFIAGTVIEKHMTRGEPITRDNAVFVVADLTSVWVDITVYQRDLGQVTVGKEVTVRARGVDRSAAGTISYVTPVVDEHTRTATARLVVDNSDGHWRPGMFLMADILTEIVTAAVVVPATAVHTIAGQDVVFVATDEGFAPHPVVVGRTGKMQMEIRSGLTPGQRYVAVGGFTLKAELGKESFGSGHAH